MPFVLLGLKSVLRLGKKINEAKGSHPSFSLKSSNLVILHEIFSRNFSRRMLKSVLRSIIEVMHPLNCRDFPAVVFPEFPLIKYECIHSLAVCLVIFSCVLQTVFCYMILVRSLDD